MTSIKQEAIQLIDRLPEDVVAAVIQYIQRLNVSTNKANKLASRRQAFERLEKIIKSVSVPNNLDYDKELAKARDEKYGRIN
ncbi:MAG: dihydrodipicolinate reductase [Lachnospiraceae bacterium]|nr:dihydrodipicolinate reductase [Lachnospiraceae bacterium]